MNRSVSLVIVMLLGLLSCNLVAQHSADLSPSKKNDEIDTTYIKSYAHIFTPRILVNNKSNAFSIDEIDTEKSINYEPNSSVNLGFGVTYKWIGLNLAFNFPFVNNDDETYGKTSRLDLQTNIYSRRYVADLFFQRYQGYYVSNPTLYNPGWQTGDPYPIREDISSTAIGATFNYVFNHRKFSYRALFNFNERQKKSAGSFTVGGGGLTYSLTSDSGLVPESIISQSETATNFNALRIRNFYAMGGYAHTFIIRNWYFALNLGLGLGLSGTRLKLIDGETLNSPTRGSVVSQFRGSLGYNNDIFYAGLSWFSGAFAIDSSSDYLVTYSLSKINFYIGYRWYNLFKKSKQTPK